MPYDNMTAIVRADRDLPKCVWRDQYCGTPRVAFVSLNLRGGDRMYYIPGTTLAQGVPRTPAPWHRSLRSPRR